MWKGMFNKSFSSPDKLNISDWVGLDERLHSERDVTKFRKCLDYLYISVSVPYFG